AVGLRILHRGARSVVAVGGVAAVGQHAQQRSADQAETEDADGARQLGGHEIQRSTSGRKRLGGVPKTGYGCGMVTADNQNDSEVEGYAEAVVHEDTGWKATALKRSALESIDDAELQLRELRAAGAAFGL